MSSRATFATLALATLLAFPCPGHAGPVNVLQPRDMSLTEGEKTDQVVWGTDEDGLALDFSLESAPTFATMIGFGISDGAVFDTLSFPPRGTSADIILAPGYSDAGSWMASLHATDGVNSDTKTFLISVANRARIWPARAFLANRDETIPLAAAAKPAFEVLVEPSEDQYSLADLKPGSFTLRFPGGPADTLAELVNNGKTKHAVDRDGNGTAELPVWFATENLRTALRGEEPGLRTLEAVLSGGLANGDIIEAPVTLRVIVTGGKSMIRVAPNPSNPEAVLSFETAATGYARVGIFDPSGRCVGTILDERLLPAGSHQVRLRGLSSGIYFYRVETSEGASTGRFVVLK